MALAVTSGWSGTCAVSGLVTRYINAHDHRNLRKEAPNASSIGATWGLINNNKNNQIKKDETSGTSGLYGRE
jgi:hypothetical protein